MNSRRGDREMRVVRMMVCIIIVLIGVSIFPCKMYNCNDVLLVRSEMESLDEELDNAISTLEETLYLLEVHHITQLVQFVETVRQAHNINDGYSTHDVVIALHTAYNEANLSKYGMSEYDWFAQCYVESRFNSKAVSNAGAKGVSQVMPSTADWLNSKYIHIKNFDSDMLFDVHIGAMFGARYMALLLEDYRNVGVALEAYHKGPGGIHKTDYRELVSRASSKYFKGR